MVFCFTSANILITTCPPRWIIPKTGGFSFSRVPRPLAPFSRLRRPLRAFFYCFGITFVACNYVDFITFYLAGQLWLWLVFDNALTKPLSHSSGHRSRADLIPQQSADLKGLGP